MVDSTCLHGSSFGRNDSHQHSNRGGFASPVGSEKTINLTRAYIQVNTIDSCDVAIMTFQPSYFE